jgi:hypothetical protein
MDILNFISWIKRGNYRTTAPIDAVTVIGVPNTTRGDAYLPVAVPISALQTNIGKLMGGGIVISEWFENGVHKALIASLTNLSTNLPYTIPAFQFTGIGPSAESFSDGLTNTNAIIAQTGAPATTAYAAGLARLYLGGDYNDWYLPAIWELNSCYNVAAIVNKVLGDVSGFTTPGINYWSSTEGGNGIAWRHGFGNGYQTSLTSKGNFGYVRAVRIHTL